MNSVRAFKNGCSGSVFCSAFKSEHVRAARSGLNVFGFEASNLFLFVCVLFVHVLFGVRLACRLLNAEASKMQLGSGLPQLLRSKGIVLFAISNAVVDSRGPWRQPESRAALA